MADPVDAATTPSGRHELQPKGRFRRWLRLKEREAQRRWAGPREHLEHKRLLVQVVLLHVRYTCGYLAAGFLVSAPIQLGTQYQWDRIGKSLVLGALCVLPFVVLWPFTRVDWGRMRLPEFKNLELAQTRWAVYASAAFLLASALGKFWPEGSLLWLFDLKIAWLSLVLMSFAWLRVKANMVLFKEFYTLNEGDDLVLSYRPRLRDAPKPADTAPPAAPSAAAEADTEADTATDTDSDTDADADAATDPDATPAPERDPA